MASKYHCLRCHKEFTVLDNSRISCPDCGCQMAVKVAIINGCDECSMRATCESELRTDKDVPALGIYSL